jgi:hypothetical protein
MNDVCVVITGLLQEDYVTELEKTYQDWTGGLIVSTWRSAPQNLLERLKSKNFIIVLSDPPEHIESTNVQTRTIYAGVLKAFELGFEYVIRMRTDINCNDFVLLNYLIRPLYRDPKKLTVICGIEFGRNKRNPNKYYLDLMIAGRIQNLLRFVQKERGPKDNRFVEKYWIEEYAGKRNLSLAELKNYLIYCLPLFRQYGIRMFFIKKNYEIVTEYCQKDFIRL